MAKKRTPRPGIYDPSRYEMLDGEMFVHFAAAVRHQAVVREVTCRLNRYLKENPIGQVLPAVGIMLDPFHWLVPDVAYVSRARQASIVQADWLRGVPDLVIEVLDPGKITVWVDREVKPRIYGKQGAAEYWLVDPENQAIEVFGGRKGQPMRRRRVWGAGDVAKSRLLPKFALPVAELFAGAAIGKSLRG